AVGSDLPVRLDRRVPAAVHAVRALAADRGDVRDAQAAAQAARSRLMAGEQERYGCMAFFETPEALVEAVRALRKAGYVRIEAYTPFPLEALDEALDIHGNAVPLATFVGGAVGAIGMLAMQYIAAVIHYPIRVGGRPFASWPAFIPPALEIMFLLAALGGVLAMLIGN